jgi:hypothetical protein
LRTIVAAEDPKKVVVSANGRIYVSYTSGEKGELRVFDANLNEIGAGGFPGEIRSFEVVDDIDGKEWLVVGLDSGQLCMRNIPEFQNMWIRSNMGCVIVTMKYDREAGQIWMGTDDGQVLLLTVE